MKAQKLAVYQKGSCRKIAIPKLPWVVLHLLTAEQEKRDSERDDR
jgi:hypothetical protein